MFGEASAKIKMASRHEAFKRMFMIKQRLTLNSWMRIASGQFKVFVGELVDIPDIWIELHL